MSDKRMMQGVVIFCSLLLCVVFFAPFINGALGSKESTPGPKTAYVEPTPIYPDQFKLWDIVQQWRKDVNLRQFKTDDYLCKVADTRASQAADRFSHDGFLEIVDVQNRRFDYMGENLARRSTEHEMLKSWLLSPKHLENLIKPIYSHSCIRCSLDTCVQIFGGN